MNPYLFEMVKLALSAMKNAYVPSSGFAVGACLRTVGGELFSGCNFENASFPLSLCAETSAIASMVSAGYYQIQEIVVTAKMLSLCPPCGGCRHRLVEFSTNDTIVHLYGDGKIQESIPIATLLPHQFQLT